MRPVVEHVKLLSLQLCANSRASWARRYVTGMTVWAYLMTVMILVCQGYKLDYGEC